MSLPDKAHPSMESRHEESTRSVRLTRAATKLKEDKETEFKNLVESMNIQIRNIEGDITERGINEDMIPAVTTMKGDIEKYYDEYRTLCNNEVPQQVRQLADNCLENLNKLMTKLRPQDQISLGSKGSATSSKRALLAARKEALKIDLDSKKKLSIQRAELAELEKKLRAKKDEMEQIKIAAEIKKADAEIEALENDQENTSQKGSINKSPPKVTSTTAENIIDITKTLANSVNPCRLPAPEFFSGDPLQYPSWKASFMTLIETRGIRSSEKIYYLKKYLTGDAKLAVDALFFFNTEDTYIEAQKILDERFGNQFTVSEAFRNKIRQWPKISGGDASGIRKFADFLRQCLHATKQIPGLSILDDCRENKQMLSKLPDWLVRKWNRITVEYTQKGSFPKFEKFVNFLLKEAEIVCNPIFATSVKSSDTPASKPNKPGRHYSRNTHVVNKDQNAPRCLFCDRTNHKTDFCRKFAQLNPMQRKEFLMKRGICFSCLSPGHTSKDCKDRATCTKCRRRHPTVLCGDYESIYKKETPHTQERNSQREQKPQDEKKEPKGECGQANSETDTFISSMIVPVYISSLQQPNHEILIYALLDTMSDTTFILQDTLDKLNTDTESTTLKLATMSTTSTIQCEKVFNIQVRGINSTNKIRLPPTYSRGFIPVNRNHIPTIESIAEWPHLAEVQLTPIQDCEIGLLIGYNCSEALAPIKVLKGDVNQPFGIKTELGWSVVGKTAPSDDENYHVCHRIVTKCIPSEVDLHNKKEVRFTCHDNSKITEQNAIPELVRILENDFRETKDDDALSQDDMTFLKTIKQAIRQDSEGYYEMPLPFRHDRPILPPSKFMASKRLEHLKRRMKSDDQYREHYSKFMNDIINSGDAEEVPESEIDKNKVWYIPHHGVYHPKKGKFRVVFDCSAQSKGTSLNDHLLQGPDLINSLVGVLCRFREKPVAVVGDIEKMFHRFRVDPDDRDYLRFLWWPQGDFEVDPKAYRMKVHLFGATSSPGCANYGLKQIAADREHSYAKSAADFLTRNFYVDDGLGSFDNDNQAITLITDVINMCSEGNLRFHKIASNDKRVLQSFPESERISDMNYDLCSDSPAQKVLGMSWLIESDAFIFRLNPPSKPTTRRGLLSIVASVYDPLGLLAPFILIGKQILQDICRENSGWDDDLPDHLKTRWEKWLTDLNEISKVKIDRCLIPKDFGPIVEHQIHHFSDACNTGYGQCSYLRIVNEKGQIHCSLIMAKSRVSPLKIVTVPRLELTAALTTAKISKFLRGEMTYDNIKEFYWTDSQITLGYIKNEARKFHVFVANRVQTIRNLTDPKNWRYVKGEDNPADHASRGMYINDLLNSNWLTGPSMLWEQNLPLAQRDDVKISSLDPEVKAVVHVANEEEIRPSILQRLERFSSWQQIITSLTFLENAARRKKKKIATTKQEVENTVIKLVQAEAFRYEMTMIKRGKYLPRRNRLAKLDPFLDENNILRVGGRLHQSSMPISQKHPVIMPKNSYISKLIVRFCHENIAHQGRGFTMNEIRSQGYYVIGCPSLVSSYIYNCVLCRKLRGQNLTQKMANLPKIRIEDTAPFTHVGIDCFGPFVIRDGRKELKRYGLIVTCMSSRAIHVETLEDMTTDSFLNALRCVIAIRGPIQSITCDRGSNFVGGYNELRQALKELKEGEVEKMLHHNCTFIFNPPQSSHMGGCWERHIRSIRSVLSGLLQQNGTRIDTATLRTLLYEAMAIVNSRPLTPEDLNDPFVQPLSPNSLITMKSKAILPFPGNFPQTDVYARKRWRKVQFLANQFWTRWKKQYLNIIQNRQKWAKTRRNLHVGDIVIIKDENLIRGEWKIGRVSESPKESDGLVRRVKITLGDSNLQVSGKRVSKPIILERPVHKLTLLLENE